MNDLIAMECVVPETSERREHARLLTMRICCAAWTMLVNGQGSPMYPWLIASTRSAVKPAAYRKFTLVTRSYLAN